MGKEPTRIQTSEDKKIGDVTFPSVEAFTSGYQDIDAGGHQVLLNYRSQNSYKDIAPHFTLDDILRDGTQISAAYKNRIILIGISDPRKRDEWSTPYEDKVPGVYIQAQMISQILDVVEGKRSLIRFLPQWAEYFWIWVLSLLGGILGWYYRSWRGLLIAQTIALLSLWIISWAFFIYYNLWSHFIPLFLASFLTHLTAFCLLMYCQSKEQLKS